jgi:hypothetical protein
MIEVEVRIAQGVDELPRGEPRHLRHHHREQRIRGDVEGHAEEDVGAALVELAGEPPLGHVELEEGVAGRERHARDVGHVPRRHDEAAGIGRAADLVDHLRDLVDVAPVRGGPRTPLVSVHRAELAVGRGPLVPDGDPVGAQVGHVGAALQEPEQLVYHALQVDLLGGEQGKTLGQVEAHLVAEDRERPRAGAVGLLGPVLLDVAKQVEIRLHAARTLTGASRG